MQSTKSDRSVRTIESGEKGSGRGDNPGTIATAPIVSSLESRTSAVQRKRWGKTDDLCLVWAEVAVK
jgi:hypothetical protein